MATFGVVGLAYGISSHVIRSPVPPFSGTYQVGQHVWPIWIACEGLLGA